MASGCFGVRRPGCIWALLDLGFGARRSVGGIRSGGETRSAGRPTAGGQPISGLRPPRTPAPSRVGPRSRDSRAPHLAPKQRGYGAVTSESRSESTQYGPCPPIVGRGGPTALGVCTVAVAAVNALVHRKA